MGALVSEATRAWGWVRHLLQGGTTSWADWQEPAVPGGRVVPGAQQLEVLRRVNEQAREHGWPVPAVLVDRVVHASAAGRGRPDLQLVGAVRPSRFGAAPVDPADLSATELLRVALQLLTEDLVERGPTSHRPERISRPWRRRYRLAGSPWVTELVRRDLRAAGHPEHPAGDLVVLGSDVPTMLADAWAHNCFTRPVESWEAWLENRRRRGGLPPGADLAAMVRDPHRTETSRVHLCIDPEPRRLRRFLGVRKVVTPSRPSHVAAELARRLMPVLDLRVHGAERAVLLREGLLPMLPPDQLDAALPVVPSAHRGWVERRAGRLRERLSEAGYPVNGDLASYGIGAPGSGVPPADPDAVLRLAVRLLLDTARNGSQESAT